jgi:hypothetical protein
MNIAKEAEQAAITSLVTVFGHGAIFSRIVDEIKRTNEAMPNATGTDKRHKVLADCKIIFDDFVIPVAERTIRLLLELGLRYLEAQVLL